jgi:mannose-6-phosphate isomerase-like protein (cupin superfamily)
MSSTATHESAAPLWFIDNLAFVHAGGEQTGGRYCVVEVAGREGDMPPLHVHHDEDETFFVLEGRLRLFVGDGEIALGAGECAVAPRGVPHVYRVESAAARWLGIGNGDGFEAFVRAVSEPAPSADLPPEGRPADPAALAAAAAERGIEILGPPGALPA